MSLGGKPEDRDGFDMEDELIHVDIIQRFFDALRGGQDWTTELATHEQKRQSQNLGAFFAELAEKHRKINLTREELLKVTNWIDTNCQYYGSWWGRRNLKYCGFWGLPTTISALRFS